jgi:zinc transport system substrate-binding protein
MKARYTKRLSARLIAALLSVLLAAGFLPGCAAPAETEDDGRMKVVTTIFPQYDFVRAIGGDLVHLRMLLSPGEEMHSYEPTPLDIKEIQNCDLFIYVGGENDVWVDRILDNMGDHRPETLRLVDLTDTVEEEIVEGMMEERGHEHDHDEADHHEDGDHDEEVDHHEDDDHDEVDHDEDEHRHGGDSSHEEHEEADEHVWTSPVKAAEITEAIAEKMAEIDPSNAEQYREGANAYEVQLLELDARFREIVESAERKTIVFGDRFPIRYFAEEYGLEYYAAFPGCSAETEPSASTLAFLIDKVREEEIPVVFSIELSNGNIAKAICESGGAVQRTFYSCHNLTREQMESGATYVSMMTENLEVLEEALGRKAESK